MGLSRDRREHLDVLYHIWGVEEVREELARLEKDPFAEPDVREFTRRWVVAKDVSSVRKNKRQITVATIVGAVLVGILLAALLSI